MKNKIDNILIGTLWLIAAVLGTCFWFNTQFGFNIFSAPHWHHLAYMQAVQQPVKPTFYISIAFALTITFVGFYILYSPRKTTHSDKQTQITAPQKQASLASPLPHAIQAHISPTNNTSNTYNNLSNELMRPVRPNISSGAHANLSSTSENISVPPSAATYAVPDAAQSPVLPASQTKSMFSKQESPYTSELSDIFESTGYTIKPNISLNGISTTLVAIGADENLWVGGVGIRTSAIKSVINKFEEIFQSTLEDIIINTSGFVISPPDAPSPESPDILIFDTPDMLRDYMQEHRSIEINQDEQENFDAYSQYISTVLEYIGKM